MFTPKAHIIIIDGNAETGRNMLSFELAITLLYNAQRTALILTDDSPLKEVLRKRKTILPELLTPAIISRKNFYEEADKYNAIIIPHCCATDELAVMASTYITLLPKEKHSINEFKKNKAYLNSVFELKKKIAATYGHSLNWIICENNRQPTLADSPSVALQKIAKLYGFRLAFPLNNRLPYQKNNQGISAQDKTLPFLSKELTYEDIYAKREIIKLAEFIFS